MKILLCTSETGTKAGGLALHCSQLKEIFEVLGHNVLVEVLLNSDAYYYTLDGGYDSALGEKIRVSYMIKSLRDKYLDSIDLCVSCGGGKTAYYSMLICKELKIPMYTVLCGSEINLAFASPELLFYNKEALGYSSAVIGLSNELNNNAICISEHSSFKRFIIPNYYDLHSTNVNNNSRINKDHITFISGAAFLGEKKGIANLLVAFSKVIHDLGRNDTLYLYGRIDDDIHKHYLRIIEKLSLQDHVYIFGYLSREEFHNKMNEADVYIQASPFEGFGNSVAEALSLGKDILITNTGFIAETISIDFPDHIITSNKPDDMAHDIYNYCVNTYSKNDGINIRLKLAEYLNKEKVVSQWKKVLGIPQNNRISIGMDSCLTVMFHDISSDFNGVDYSQQGFANLVETISKRGLRLCSVREFFQAPHPEDMIICTFDDGYESVFTNALPIMKEYGFTATVYVCPDLIGIDNYWNHKDPIVRQHLSNDMITKLVESGWEIGSHGLSHLNLLRLSEHELDDNLSRSKELLLRFGNIDSFCYPYGSFNLFIKNRVKRYYKNAFSVSIGGNNYINDLFQITRLTPEELIHRLELDI